MDPRFPGAGRSLGAGRTQTTASDDLDSNLQVRLLDDSTPPRLSDTTPDAGQQLPDGRFV